MRLAGHTLVAEGAPHDGEGYRIPRGNGPTSGRAKCSCGELSPLYSSAGMRKRWHRRHKEVLKTNS